MKKPKIGLITFSDGRPRVHKIFLPVIKQRTKEVREMFDQIGDVDLMVADRIVTDSRIAVAESKKMAAHDVDGTVFSFPSWSFPNYPILAATLGKGPFLFLAKKDPKNAGLVSLLSSKGGLQQLQIKHMCTWGDFGNEKFIQRVKIFCRVAFMVNQLRGQIYGTIGGRSMGMYTAVPNIQVWMRQFGVDVEHIDQLEVIRLAEKVSKKRVNDAFNWLKKNVRKIAFNDKLTEESLKRQIKCYYATQQIVDQYQLDFFGVKCHYELSENYCTQCLSAAFFNDPYDIDGNRRAPIVMACEADADGALTMQIMHLISGSPVLFLDFKDYNEKLRYYVLGNCGSQATWYAARSNEPFTNLQLVSFLPTVPIFKTKGAHVHYFAAPGKVTLARLGREGEKYWMAIMRGEFISIPKSETDKLVPEYPFAFVKIDIQPEKLIQILPSNHIHALCGDWIEELLEGCKILDIEPRLLSN